MIALTNKTDPQISIQTLVPKKKQRLHVRLGIKLMDKIMGLSRMQELYEFHQMQGLSKEEFADKLLSILDVKIEGEQELIAKIPKEGPVVLCANHPFGGLEGVILARIIGKVRPDLQVLVNFALEIFAELRDYFIFTNPLSERDPRNGPSLRTSMAHVKNGGALLLFPSGKVSYRNRDENRIIEHPWNRLVAKLVNKNDAQFVPIWVEGQNSERFYRIESIYYPLRMLFLGRELLNKSGQIVTLRAGNALSVKDFTKDKSPDEQTALSRCLSIAQSTSWKHDWAATDTTDFLPVAEEIPSDMLRSEIASLPKEQHLVAYKQYDVYYGFQSQVPNVVKEIARLREIVFREHDEGSGEERDTDKFDATYTQLFIVNRDEGRIIGAYRMGQTDNLLKAGGPEQFYLSQMFEFDNDFFNQTEPCLEMGRSFLIPEYQQSYYGLFLLWRGIGAFVCKFPQYRRLYGTVSISKLYDKRSISIMEKALVEPLPSVRARTPWNVPLHPDLAHFDSKYGLQKHLSTYLRALEADGKDMPVLLKHYKRLGAKFYCLGLDGGFAGTPGLLLCVDLLNMPDNLSKKYLAEGLDGYRECHR